MKIEKLTSEDMLQASQLARFVYDHSLRAQARPEMTAFFEEYVKPEYLQRELEAGELTVWGVRGKEYLLAVGALNREGLVTMLYVHPRCQGEKLGKKLVFSMQKYARTELGLSGIAVNATPAFTAGFFQKAGFSQTDYSQNSESPFISMEAPSVYLKDYPQKKVPGWLTAVIFVAVSLIAVVGTAIYTLLLVL